MVSQMGNMQMRADGRHGAVQTRENGWMYKGEREGWCRHNSPPESRAGKKVI